MFSNNQLKTAGSGLLLVLVVVGLLVGATGGAIAQTSTATPTDSTTGVELANSTVAVDNDTRSVYADVAAGENSSVTLEVQFVGVDADGNETKFSPRTVSLNASEERLVERTDVNTSAYSSYRVMVTAPNVDSTNATAEVGKVAEVAGSGGGVLDGSGVGSIGIAGIVVLLLLGAVLFTGGDD